MKTAAPQKVLQFFNRQKTRAVTVPLLRKMGRYLLEELLEQPAYELAVHLINAAEMAPLNEKFLQHTGSTDIITFDYTEEGGPLAGELFISIDDAIAFAEMYGTTWQAELARYLVHGVLHLRGYDDLQPGPRRLMKREENRLTKALCERFGSRKLEKRTRRVVKPQRGPTPKSQ